MPLPAAFLDELKARTPLPALVGRRVKLERAGRDWRGCCPFHSERTPSFYVYDDHFHCFGCGEHGDALSFLTRIDGREFRDAVTLLAAEAGLEVPQPSPESAEQERRRADLHEVLEAACAIFRRRLAAPEGARARAYLRGRGISAAAIEGWGIGWAPSGRGALAAELGRAGIAADRLAEAGLLRADPEERGGRPAAELFFERVTFPIRDGRGRLISFGGRTLGDGQPKYLNGPETEIFSKRRTLFGLDRARAGVRGGAALLVAEGYLDVIALHEAGFTGAVAPLGTALTEAHLDALWRLSPVPVLCFDGDAAGGRAAERSLRLALPKLSAERSLSVALLPPGEDPDALLRARGAPAMQAVLDSARPLVEALFVALRGADVLATPEAVSACLARLDAAAASIGDRGLAAEYRRALRDRFYAGRKSGAGRQGVPRRSGMAGRTGMAGRPDGQGGAPAWAAAPGRRAAPATPDLERARMLAALILRHPILLRDVEQAWESLALPPSHTALRDAVLAWHGQSDLLDSEALLDHLNRFGLAMELHSVLSGGLPLPACARADAMPADVEAAWWQIFGLLNRHALEQAVARSTALLASAPDEIGQQRHIRLVTALRAVACGEAEHEADP